MEPPDHGEPGLLTAKHAGMAASWNAVRQSKSDHYLATETPRLRHLIHVDTSPAPAPDESPPPIDPDDPRLDAFVEALACALLEDLQSNTQR